MEPQNIKSAYICSKLHSTVTIVSDKGVTPLVISCPICKGDAISKVGGVDTTITATHEWYKPTDEEIKKESDGNKLAALLEHVNRGGLILRKVEREEENDGEFNPSKILEALHKCFGVMMQFSLYTDSIQPGKDFKRESVFVVNVGANVIIDARKEAERLYYEATKAGTNEAVKAIEDLNDINYNSNEGVLLFAALIHLTMVKKKTALEIIELLNYTANKYDRWQGLNDNRAVLIPRDAINSYNEAVTVWRFVLKAANGETIAQGEHYNQKESAIKTLERNFPNFKIVEKED